jgi:phosphatidylserine/phosphatidylglycerophosphate/cardiolipin synthase-like enzyme
MKKYNKLISTLFSILFIIIFSFYHFDEYKTFHQNKIKLEKQKEESIQKINSFEITDIKELKDIQFYYTPNKELLVKIVDLIDNAKNEIYIETYMLTEKRIYEALIKAYKK